MIKIKLYGERNTGTNYLSELIELNFQAYQLRGTVPNHFLWKLTEFQKDLYFKCFPNTTLGWKHAKVPLKTIENRNDKDQIKFICLVKNPYSYLLSLHKRPYHIHGKAAADFNTFLQQKWMLRSRDLMSVAALESPVELWNEKVASYFKLQEILPKQCLILRYEDLVIDPLGELNKIAKLLNTEALATFKNKESSTKKEKKSYSDYKSYYQEEKWRSKLSQADVDLINSRLSTELTQKLGYEIIKTL